VLFGAFLFLAVVIFAMAVPIDANLKPGSRLFEEPDAPMIEAGNQ
jgi:hypothetical protein